MDPLDKSQVTSIPWDEKERRILSAVNARASSLMWAGYGVYAVGCAASFLLFKDGQKAALAIMVLQFLMVIWMGTRAMFANMSAVLRLSLEANRSMMPAFEKAARFADQVGDGTHPAIARAEAKLSEAVSSLKAIQDAIERSTKPMPVTRRNGEKAAV